MNIKSKYTKWQLVIDKITEYTSEKKVKKRSMKIQKLYLKKNEVLERN